MKGQKSSARLPVFPDSYITAILGHELANVLNGLMGMAEILASSGLTTEQCQWLKAIEHSGRQMQSIIQPGRFLAQDGEARIIPHERWADGVELLEQVVISHTPSAGLNGNCLLLALSPGLPGHWYLDPCLLRQVLDNLVCNALKFTRDGLVVIEASAVYSSGSPGMSLRLRVTDNGPGFDSSAVKNHFKAGQQSPPAIAEEPVNRGLGLYICKTILVALGGRVSCTNPGDGGTRFEVVFPGALPCPADSGKVLRSPLLDLVYCRVSLGDPMRNSLENFLQRLGVAHGDRPVEQPGYAISLLVTTEETRPGRNSGALLFTPIGGSGVARREWLLTAPLLESTLGTLLIEIVLDWRRPAVRSGTGD